MVSRLPSLESPDEPSALTVMAVTKERNKRGLDRLVVLWTFVSLDKTLSVTTRLNATEQHFWYCWLVQGGFNLTTQIKAIEKCFQWCCLLNIVLQVAKNASCGCTFNVELFSRAVLFSRRFLEENCALSHSCFIFFCRTRSNDAIHEEKQRARHRDQEPACSGECL